MFGTPSSSIALVIWFLTMPYQDGLARQEDKLSAEPCLKMSRKNTVKIKGQKFLYQPNAFAAGSTAKLYYAMRMEYGGKKCKDNHQCLVIKEVEMGKMDPKAIGEIENEKLILEELWRSKKGEEGKDGEGTLSHIVKLIAAERIQEGTKQNKMLFVEERGRENVYQFWERRRQRAKTQRDEDQIGIEELEQILGQMLEALWQIHQNGIIHLDIKMENFVCMPKGSDEKCEEVKLVDFGSAIREEKAEKEQQNCEKMHSGTPEFMSPEQLGRCGKITLTSDIWSFGVLAFYMLNLATGSVTASTYLDRYPMPQLYPFQIDEIVAEERKWREKVILETKSKLEKEKIMEKFREFGGLKRQKVRNLVEKYAKMEKEDKEFFGVINLRENSIRNVGNMQIGARIEQIKAMIKDCLKYNPEQRLTAKQLLAKYFGKEIDNQPEPNYRYL